MEIYVDRNAIPDGKGTAADPFATLTAANKAAKPGDVVLVAPGVYYESVTLGTDKVEWIAAGEGVVLDGRYSPDKRLPNGNMPPVKNQYAKQVELKGDNIHFEGFTVRNVPGQPIGITGDNATVCNCTLDFAYGGGLVADRVKSPLIEGVRMYRCDQKRYDPTNKTGGPAGVQVNLLFKNVQGGVIRDCEIAHNLGEGIALAMGSRNCVIEGCVVHTNLHMHIVLNGSQNNVIRGNFIYHTGDREFLQSKSKEPPPGLTIADEKKRAQKHGLSPSSGNQIYNNVVVGMGINFNCRESANSNGALIDTLIANNTFVNATKINVKIPTAAHKGSRFINNIVVQDKGRIAQIAGGSGITIGDNLWSKSPGIAGATVGDAGLVDHDAPLNNAWVGNYALLDGSMAIGQARPLAEIGDDYNGVGRGKRPSLGAFEFVASEEPEEPEDEEPPEEPTGDDWRVHYAAYAEHSNAAVEAVMKMVAAWEAAEK